MSASPLPWTVEEYVNLGLVFVKDADGRIICRVREADARLIVRSVNATLAAQQPEKIWP